MCIRDRNYVGVYQPRDGRDALLYTFPATGISLMNVIPPVRNKVNTTDLIGPSSQAFWADGAYGGSTVSYTHLQTTLEDHAPERNTVAQCYEQVLKDLNDALGGLTKEKHRCV